MPFFFKFSINHYLLCVVDNPTTSENTTVAEDFTFDNDTTGMDNFDYFTVKAKINKNTFWKTNGRKGCSAI